MQHPRRGLAAFLVSALCAPAAWSAGTAQDAKLAEHGRYLVQVSGCNDCHTPGYLQNDGKAPAAQWLTGSAVGFQGPWGTSYPSNLRLLADRLSEAQWLARVRQPMRPPMPWFNLKAMSERDLLAIYRYLRAAGPAGAPAPAAAAPGVQVATPYFDFTPKNLPSQVSSAGKP
ncbi:cytochrome C [Parasulfuritortus cantonensis]|uniref:Cytochrome C n=1 Tax=Parasulfuritortus cantonensis TaxID=2528202 RepID=A0A4R1BD11_9PROT|nr:cytochrome C [Parasulfuritortus cantonensis]TCJ14976.1 cytochrome C [Parasulfuritortus cantonensis]